MANEIYNSSDWGNGVCDNTIDWGVVYKDFAGCTPAFSNTKSCEFDGVDDYVDTGTISLGGASAFTVSCWVKTSNTSFQNLMGDNNLRYIISTASNRLDLTFNGSVDFRSTNFILNSGQWHNVITTFDGSLTQANRLKVYVDGVQVTNNLSGTTSTTLTASGDFMIGRRGSFSQKEWNGFIDEVAIWNSVLSIIREALPR